MIFADTVRSVQGKVFIMTAIVNEVGSGQDDVHATA